MQSDIPAKLRWACRRGMLELDLLLEGFLQSQYQNLSQAEKDEFNQLLECNDQDLFKWLFTNEFEPEPKLLSIVEKIRRYVRTRI